MKRDLLWFALRQSIQVRHLLLWFCLLALLSVTVVTQGAAFGRHEERRTYQESPLLSPLATPHSSSLTTTLPVTMPLSLTTSITEVAPGVTPLVVTLPVTTLLPITVNEVITTSVAETTSTPAALPTATAELVNHGQVSLLLVGAVLASILVVIAVVIGRRQ